MSFIVKVGSVEILFFFYINMENKYKNNILYNFKIYLFWVNVKFLFGFIYVVF